MEKLELDEIKKIELEILIEIDKFCRERGIQYSLAYGTLIGAIRHKGFIPWDDDIDIWMSRPNYNRFITEFRHPYYRVQSPEITKKWNCLFAKVDDIRTFIDKKGYESFGIFIDIFPVDGLSSDKLCAVTHYRKITKIREKYNNFNIFRTKSISFANTFKHNLLAVIVKLTSWMRMEYYYINKIGKLNKKYDYSTSSLVGDLNWGDESRIFEKEIFDNCIDVTFEGLTFSSIKQYDNVLSRIYGNYMQLPPVEQQVQYHGFSAYKK